MSEKEPASWAMVARPDGTVVLGFGPFEEHSTAPGEGVAFYCNDYALREERPWKVPARAQVIRREELAANVPSIAAPTTTWSELDAAPFAEVFHEVSSAIQRGVFEKTVPVVVEHGLLVDGPVAGIGTAAARRGAPLLPYAWVNGDHGFAGATPEVLFSRNGSRLTTMALAGTAKREEREVFAVDEKEIREHEYVAQSLVAKLSDFGDVTRRERDILDLGSIVHFHTAIEVELYQEASDTALLRRLHPTPALGPLPRTGETLGMLLEWRNRLGCPAEFGAPFGVAVDGRLDVLVAIRGIWWQNSELRLPAGCGVIEASRLVNEWRELRLKREAVKAMIGQAG